MRSARRSVAVTVAAAALAAAALAACSSSHHAREVDAERAGKLLIDRNWIDVMPRQKEDRLHVFRFVPKMGGGVYQDRNVYKGEFELFMFKAQKGELTLRFPDRSETYKTGFKIERVDGPEPFDLKLTLDRSPRGPRVYYSVEAQTGDLDALLARQLPDDRN